MLFLHGFTSVYGSLWKLATNAKFQLRISEIICPWSKTTLGHGVNQPALKMDGASGLHQAAAAAGRVDRPW